MAYVGEIKLFSGDVAPAGWKFCDGSPIDIQSNTLLFIVSSGTQGFVGDSQFPLPSLAHLDSKYDNCKHIICTDGDFPTR